MCLFAVRATLLPAQLRDLCRFYTAESGDRFKIPETRATWTDELVDLICLHILVCVFDAEISNGAQGPTVGDPWMHLLVDLRVSLRRSANGQMARTVDKRPSQITDSVVLLRCQLRTNGFSILELWTEMVDGENLVQAPISTESSIHLMRFKYGSAAELSYSSRERARIDAA
jgi:hypothetical protein